MKALNVIRNLIVITGLIIVFQSCKKEDSLYVDGGVFPYNQENSETKQPTLSGTTWILTTIIKDFATQTLNDTIKFNNLFYSINGKENTDSYLYSISETMELGNPYNLVLYGFSPFGDNGIWSANIVNTFIADSVINLTEFSNSSDGVSKIKATFVRLE